MIAGSRVLHRATMRRATVARVTEHGSLVVDIDGGGEEVWTRDGVHVLARTYAPRGVAKVDDRMRAAARLVDEGQSRRAVAAVYGVAKSTVDGWIERVRDAEMLRRAR